MTTVAHLTTVDLSLRFLLLAQLRGARDAGGDAVGDQRARAVGAPSSRPKGSATSPLHSSTRAADPLADLRAARELWTVLRRERPTVLHTHNPKPGLYGRVLGRLAGVPIVVNTVHGLYATDDDPLAKRGRWSTGSRRSRRASPTPSWCRTPRTSRCCAGSASAAPRGCSATASTCAASTRRRLVADRSRPRCGRELGVDDDQSWSGPSARLVAEKGYPELFEAMAAPRPERFRARRASAATTPTRPTRSPRPLIDAARAAGRAVPRPSRRRRRAVRGDGPLRAAVAPRRVPAGRDGGRRERTPVIATDVRGCRQVVEPDVTGLLVPVRDAAPFAAAIDRLGRDDARTRPHGGRSPARAEAHFDERAVVDACSTPTPRSRRGKRIDGPALTVQRVDAPRESTAS